MNCTVAQRRRARSAAATLERDPLIRDAEPVPPTRGTYDAWTISIVVGAETVPASVWQTVATTDLDTVWHKAQSDYQRVLAVV